MHLHDYRRLDRRLALRLSERGLNLELVDRLIDRNRSEASGRGRMSSGSPAGGGAVSYSMLAAICAMLTEISCARTFTKQTHAEANEASF